MTADRISKLVLITTSIAVMWRVYIVGTLGGLAAAVPVSQRGASTPAPWWYKPSGGGNLGPEDWAQAYPNCAGPDQSPINIVQANHNKSLGRVHIEADNEGCSDVTFTNTGHYWEVRTPTCSLTVGVDNKSYQLQQFHWHSPSEHTFGSGYFDAECHFVHTAADGSTLVIAVLLSAISHRQPVGGNPFLDRFWNNSLFNSNATVDEVPGLDPYRDLFPADPAYFFYTGSSTTPPCIPNVNWVVFREPVTMSIAQLNMYADALGEMPQPNIGEDARPLQPVGSRVVQLGGL